LAFVQLQVNVVVAIAAQRQTLTLSSCDRRQADVVVRSTTNDLV